MDPLHEIIGALAAAPTLDALTSILREKARVSIGADGVSFVMREGEMCYYVDEDAIAPLWKGRRFPIGACISGWVMRHGQMAVVPDIYADPRVPHDAYRDTFVKSLVMAPAPQVAPLAAMGAYWAVRREPSWNEQYTLQALANGAGAALRNMKLLEELRQTPARTE